MKGILILFRIILIIALGVFLFSTIRKFLFGSVEKKLYERVEKRFVGQRIIVMALKANFFGQKSKGGRQVRGNGALVLTETELWFSLAAPEREISIPLSQIKSVILKRSHLGKTVFRPLLYIEYSSGVDDDSIAWHVNQPEEWKAAIEEIKKVSW